MNWNLAGSIYGRSSIKIAHFVPDPLTNMATTGNSCFWLANFFKSSPLKPLGQMNRNLVGSTYGRSSMKIAHFVPIGLQTWLPPKLGRQHLWNVLYVSLFISSRSVSKHDHHMQFLFLIGRFLKNLLPSDPWNCLAIWTETW
jgi:hypothetical protein